MRNKKGFTMVELLVVLVIVAVLAAVATPIYLANVQRARVSEAVSTMALVRQGLRDYQISGGSYFDIAQVATGVITNGLPTSVTGGTPSPATAGVSIQLGVAQYFANTAFAVDTTPASATGASGMFAAPQPPVVDFLITAKGTTVLVAPAVAGENTACDTTAAITTNCATKTGEVVNYLLEMDNSGRTFVSYDNGTNWSSY